MYFAQPSFCIFEWCGLFSVAGLFLAKAMDNTECERQPKIQSESRGQDFVNHGRRGL